MVLGLMEGVVLVAREVTRGKNLSDPAPVIAEIMRLLATPTFVVINVAAASLAFVGLAGWFAARSPTPWLARLRAARSSLDSATLVVATATLLALSYCVCAVLGLLHLGQSGTLKMFADAFKDASPGMLLLGVLVIGVGAGICEETFFRGYFQTRVVARWGRWPGILLTAACFALVHLDLAQGLFALSIGIFLGWLTERAGSIRPAMVVHAVNNSVSILLSAGGDPSETSPVMSWTLILASLVLSVAGVVRLARSLPAGGDLRSSGKRIVISSYDT
jgi:membrane protease YdiL (CAAX protease family)